MTSLFLESRDSFSTLIWSLKDASARDALSRSCCKFSSDCSFLSHFSRMSVRSRSATSRWALRASISLSFASSCGSAFPVSAMMTVDSRLFPAKAAPVTIPTMSTPANATGELHVDNLGVTTTEDVGCATTAATTRSFGFKLGGPRITILSPGNVVVKSMSGFSCSRVAQSNPLCSTNHRTFSPCLNVYHSLPSCTLVPSSASLPETPRHVVSPSATEASTRPPRVDSLASPSSHPPRSTRLRSASPHGTASASVFRALSRPTTARSRTRTRHRRAASRAN